MGYKTFRNLLLGALTFGFANLAVCATYIVDGKNPAAKDDNTGTLEAPFKTIQAAMDKAQAGDTVGVRGGVYHGPVRIAKSGSGPNTPGPSYSAHYFSDPVKWLTLEASGDERVVIDGTVEIPADLWKLVEGKTNTYVAAFKGELKPESYMYWVHPSYMYADGVPVKHATTKTTDARNIPGMPEDSADKPGWFYDKEKGLFYVNLGGKIPGKDARITIMDGEHGIEIRGSSFVRVRKLEIRGFTISGIQSSDTLNCVFEDNYIHDCGNGFSLGGIVECVIRRNVISDVTRNGIQMTCRGGIVEGNIIKRFNRNPYGTGDYVSSINMVSGNVIGMAICHNIITENLSPTPGGAGPWTDISALGMCYYGNVCYNLRGMGFYIEAGANGSLLRWNTVMDNEDGIVFRQNATNMAVENYVVNNSRFAISMGSCDSKFPVCTANSFIGNWVIDNGLGVEVGPDLKGKLAHVFDHNIYRVPEKGQLFRFGSTGFTDIVKLRAELGQEFNGQVVTDFDPASIGLATFRLDGTTQSWRPIPMIANPTLERNDLMFNAPNPYFWQRGTFEKTIASGWSWSNKVTNLGWPETLYQLGAFASHADMPEVTLAGKSPETDLPNLDPKTAAHGGFWSLICGAEQPGPSSPQGAGFWSVSLPTVDDAIIDVTAWLKAEQVKAATKGGGVYMFVEFRNETGQNVIRQFLVGGPNGGDVVAADFAEGTYDWKQLKGFVTAPKGARWFTIALGTRACSGWASFDDIDIQTRAGEKPADVNVVRLPIEIGNFTWAPINLTGLLNRPLADEIDDDGEGGWTDQGAMADLRNLQAGEYEFNGVKFSIAKGNACLIMKSKFRKSDKLPEGGKITLDSKAETLAFLHSGGWLDMGKTHATYIIHYSDGTSVSIPVIGGINIHDWTHGEKALEGAKYDPVSGMTLLATKVVCPKFVTVSVWMTVWENPNPEKQISSIEIKSENQGVFGLLGISLGTKKR